MHFASRATTAALLLGFSISILPSFAFARQPKPDDTKVVEAREAARALALKALQKIDGGRFLEGIELLEQAEKRFHAPTHVLYLAQARAALGQTANAAQTYDALVREELPNYAPDEFREAERIGSVELAALESRVGRVKIVLVGARDFAGRPNVKLDGSARQVAGEIVYLEPGAHEIEVEISSEVRKARVSVRAGELVPLIFEFGGVRPKVRDGEVGFAKIPPADAGPPYLIPGVILLSTGGVALAVGAVTGVLSLQDVDELSDRCPAKVGCDPADRALADSARLLGNVSTAMFSIGAAAAVTGAILVAIPAPSKAAPTSFVRPVLAPTFVGVEGSF